MTEQYSQCNLHRWSSSNPTKACPTCCKNQNFIIDFVVCITELERENATMAKAQEESWAENARLRKALEQIADTPHLEGGSGEQMAKMFDVKEVRQKIDHSLFDDTFEVMDVLTTACDRIEALQTVAFQAQNVALELSARIPAATALTERLRLAEAVCEAADSVSSEPDVSDLHSCYNMGVELGQRLAAWRKVKIEP